MTTHDGWDEGSGSARDISGWETRTSRPGQVPGGFSGRPPAFGAPVAASQAEPPLPPGLNPRGPGAGRPAGSPSGRPYGNPAGRPSGNPAGGPAKPQPQYGGGGQGSGLPPELDPHGPRRPGGPGRTGRWSRRRKVRFTIFTLVLALLVVGVGSYVWASSNLNHSNVLVSYPGEPAAGKGTNWLIVGSDSREGLTKADEQALHTGSDSGARTDSMMILHIGSNGNTLMSIPRDSYVTIPAWTDSSGVKHSAATHKINAAFAEGGGQLLVQTLEYNTGIHVDHYAEIGFSGFVNVVDDLGGIHMCLPDPIVDKDSGANLKAGCQTLNGAQSLAFVRERHAEATQDLARMQHQQQFLAALSHKAASPTTLLNPFKIYPTLSSGLDLLTVDNGTGLTDLGRMFFALKGVQGGNGKSLTVPIANANYPTPSDGDAVLWNMTQAKQVFAAIQNDTTVPTFSD